MENNYIFVKINTDRVDIEDRIWFKTKYYGGFIGKLINQCWDTFYFELYEEKILIAVPIKWVKWMMPLSKEGMEKINDRK